MRPRKALSSSAFGLVAFVAASATLLWATIDGAAARGCDLVLRGNVIDTATRLPVLDVAVRVVGLNRMTFTSSAGWFEFRGLCPGEYSLEMTHVAFFPQTETVLLPADCDTTTVSPAIRPRSYELEEVLVRNIRVAPLTSVARPGYQIPTAPLQEFGSRDLVESVALLPGVTLSGDRPFFRGIGFEQLQPLVDGIPAREPITGEWILPPPQSVSSAELLSGVMDAEASQSLGGVLSVRLAEGGERFRSRLNYGADGLAGVVEGPRRSDLATISGSGPTSIKGLYYSASWQGRVDDGALAYSRGLPEQRMGWIPIGNRMRSRNTASLKLTWRPRDRPWKATAGLLFLDARKKVYHDQYSRSGWVGFNSRFDRYTTFETLPASIDSLVFYDGPAAVPVRRTRSTLAFLTARRVLGDNSWLIARAYYTRHRRRTEPSGPRINDDKALEEWLHRRVTQTTHQEEEFYAVHGSDPEFESGKSQEAGLGATANIAWTRNHRLRAGANVVVGTHQYVTLAGPVSLRGSFHNEMETVDGHGYLEDTWYSDRRSWMQLALRYVYRSVSRSGESWSGSRWAPAISFHQPMTDRDALHVQAGVSYQFPSLKGYFVIDPEIQGLGLNAQKMWRMEVGMQHHFSEAAVGYLGAYLREYSDVVFTTELPSLFESLFSNPKPSPPQFIDARGIEMVLDHQFHPAVVGQASLVWSRTTENDVEVPWSRRLFARNWLSWFWRDRFVTTVSSQWSTGRPYVNCIEGRGCFDWQLMKGRLPAHFETDLALRWQKKVPGRPTFEIRAEVFNILGREIPVYDFGIYPMGISNRNFLAYYHETGSTEGYAVDNGNATRYVSVSNPQTRTPGRSYLIGVGVRF